MITRYALFEGDVAEEERSRFETAILEDLLPAVRKIPGVVNATASFARARDPGAAEITLFMVTTYRDIAAVEAALISPQRRIAQAVTQQIFAAYGSFRISHHLTETCG